jgi:hypothetical protein
MPLLLPLVIDVVDLIDEAKERNQELDIEAAAQQLLEAHPEDDKSTGEIAAMLRQQQKTAKRSSAAEDDW